MIKFRRSPGGLYANNGLDIMANDYVSVAITREGRQYVTRYYTRSGLDLAATMFDEKHSDARVGATAVLTAGTRWNIRSIHVVAVTAAINARVEQLRAEIAQQSK